eukprot:1158859-Rhodomonas_salina.1
MVCKSESLRLGLPVGRGVGVTVALLLLSRALVPGSLSLCSRASRLSRPSPSSSSWNSPGAALRAAPPCLSEASSCSSEHLRLKAE